ncbi:Rib/alpha-like domain-containing protein [Corynebacterium suedekumii]|nr:Rib/alpha-like domain-containing protein [Corynebacterium suedekumii]
MVPTYDPVTVAQGGNFSVEGPANGTDLPEGLTYEHTPDTPEWVTVNPDGSIVVSPSETTTPGLTTVEFRVTHPDGSVEPVSMIVNVINDNQPTYEPIQAVQDGPEVTTLVPTNSDDTPLPEGTTFESTSGTPTWATVNPDGSVTVDADYETPLGPVNVPVLITYPDGTSTLVNAPVSIVNADDPRYAPTTVAQGGNATTAAPVDATDGVLPPGTTLRPW